VIVVAPSWGCAHGPRNFRKVQSPAPLVRARAVGLGRRQADSQVMPALVNRLSDSDPVVRLAAHEELRKRTGRDFGYVPWASPEERAGAIEQWRTFVGQGRGSPDRMARPLPSPSPQSKTLPGGTSQVPVS
jgi:HEAT repeats